MEIKPNIDIIQTKDSIQQIKHKKIGVLKPKKNHHIFEINIETMEVKKAEFSILSKILIGKKPRKEILINKNCFYISAMNKKNALKKFNKLKNK